MSTMEIRDRVGRSNVPSRRAQRSSRRCDTLIASAVLVLLVAGWIMNFVDPKQAAWRFNELIASYARLV